MKIAVLSPIFQPVPPKGWGGVELVVYNLVEELVKRGHDVTLFSASGATTSARNITNGLKPADHDPNQTDPDLSQRILDDKLLAKQDEFDIIHGHTSHRFPYLENNLHVPFVLTVHTIYREEWKPQYLAHPKIPIVSISKSQAKLSGLNLNFIDNVYNGIHLNDFEFSNRKGNYFAWIGRIVRAKGLLQAIKIAEKAKIKLKVAGPFIENNEDDRENVAEVKKAMESPLVEYLGEINKEERNALFTDAIALLNPIIWHEPFGLVVPEANACGLPVIAYDRGAMKELIIDGLNGYVVNADDEKSFIEKVKSLKDMPEDKYRKMREKCRKHVENNFLVGKMVDGYEKVYKKVIADWKKKK